jgi:hypothetical protein
VESVDKENLKATCNYCNRLIGCHHRTGTSSMRTYLQSNCPNSPLKKLKLLKNQTLLQMSFKKAIDDISSKSPQMGFVKYDSNIIRREIVRYFIKNVSWLLGMWRLRGLNNLLMYWNLGLKCHVVLLYKEIVLKLYMEEKLKLKTLLSD